MIITSNDNLTDTLRYNIKVIKDKFPTINVVSSYDTINNRFNFEGEIKDDYGFSKLSFICQNDSNSIIDSKEIPIQNVTEEKFFFSYNFDELKINDSQTLFYYFKVWDNDYVNGPKATKSSSYSYKKASSEELTNYNEIINKKTKSSFQKAIIISKELEEDIKKLNKKLLTKQNLSWEEKKDLQDILKKQKMLEEQIETTQNKNKQSRTDQKTELLKNKKI